MYQNCEMKTVFKIHFYKFIKFQPLYREGSISSSHGDIKSTLHLFHILQGSKLSNKSVLFLTLFKQFFNTPNNIKEKTVFSENI